MSYRGSVATVCVSLLALLAASTGPALADSVSTSANVVEFTAPGESRFTVPKKIRNLHVVATGDNGSALGSAVPSGAGAMVTADLVVRPGMDLYMEVGLGGGFAGGGGESDVRTCPAALCAGLGTENDPRLVVAGGGGASSHYFPGGNAGSILTGPCFRGVFAQGESSYGFYDDQTGSHYAGAGGGGCNVGGAGLTAPYWPVQNAGAAASGGAGSSGGGAGFFGGGAGIYRASFTGGGGGGSSFGPVGSVFAPSPMPPGCNYNSYSPVCVPFGGGSVVLSFLQEPEDDDQGGPPAAATPELDTLLLFAAGAAAVLGYARFRG